MFVRKSAPELPFGKQPSRNPSPKPLVYLGVGFLAFSLSVTTYKRESGSCLVNDVRFKSRMKLSVWAIALSTTVNCASCFALPPSEQIVTSKHVKAELPENTDLARWCAGYNFPHVTCINRYGSVIKGDFERKFSMALQIHMLRPRLHAILPLTLSQTPLSLSSTLSAAGKSLDHLPYSTSCSRCPISPRRPTLRRRYERTVLHPRETRVSSPTRRKSVHNTSYAIGKAGGSSCICGNRGSV